MRNDGSLEETLPLEKATPVVVSSPEELLVRGIDATGAVYSTPEPIIASINVGLSFGLLGGDQANSSIWRIALSKHGDVYIGSSEMMWAFKLSLHKSGDWRMAQTDRMIELGSEVPKVVRQFSAPEDYRPGWKLGCSLILPITCMHPRNLSTPNLAKKVSWWTPLLLPQALAFDVYVGLSEQNGSFEPIESSMSFLGSIEGPKMSVHVVSRGIFDPLEQDMLLQCLREYYVTKRAIGPMQPSLNFVERAFNGRSTIIDLGDQNYPFSLDPI